MLPLVTGRKLATYRIAVRGEETLRTGMGDMRTLHVATVKTAAADGIDVWLAIDHDLLPVKVRNTPREYEWPTELLASELLTPASDP